MGSMPSIISTCNLSNEVPVNIERTGIILNTENYESCVAFYKDLFGLDMLFHEEDGVFKLTCFKFGGSYLMIETGGKAKQSGKTTAECASKLRFNVADIEEAAKRVRAFGIEAQIERSEWGDTINIFDPDGNRVALRDEKTFIRQINI